MEAREIARQHVDLQIDPAAGFQLAQRLAQRQAQRLAQVLVLFPQILRLGLQPFARIGEIQFAAEGGNVAGGTVVGLFDNMSYDEGCVEMHPGEIFLAYSDGVTEPENEFGEFGEERLIDLVSANRTSPLVQISQTVTLAVDDWIGDNEQPDDITLVLARAR